MGFFRRAFMTTAGIHDASSTAPSSSSSAHPSTKIGPGMKSGHYTGIPQIPSDIAYHSNKQTGGSTPTGIFSNARSNPFVIAGMGLTVAALLGMLRNSFYGDKMGTQKMMQYRIMAQFFTVTAMVAGVTVFGATYKNEPQKEGEQEHR
ncbi:hypothetical protein WR25_05997 [Diploscapter pachys]|uniref:HIG1 domain-containing protein n=1 Tax=Diploscapter pachys TaxID=2018661 RepID=A0A2A2LQ98_9BILA|nr:hypothetical protein WR25_05997 [Diploscapter pachys]